jgi:hypothetical protein
VAGGGRTGRSGAGGRQDDFHPPVQKLSILAVPMWDGVSRLGLRVAES